MLWEWETKIQSLLNSKPINWRRGRAHMLDTVTLYVREFGRKRDQEVSLTWVDLAPPSHGLDVASLWLLLAFSLSSHIEYFSLLGLDMK